MLKIELKQFYYNIDLIIVLDFYQIILFLLNYQYQLFSALKSKNRLLTNKLTSYTLFTQKTIERK